MGLLDSILGAPFKGILSVVGGIIDNTTTTDEERLAAHAQLRVIEIQAQKIETEADAKFADLQAQVIIAEAQSDSWMTRNWRPVTMLGFLATILYTQVIAPMFGLLAPPLPPEMWAALKIGLGGYVVGRTAEKIMPDVVEAMKAKHQK